MNVCSSSSKGRKNSAEQQRAALIPDLRLPNMTGAAELLLDLPRELRGLRAKPAVRLAVRLAVRRRRNLGLRVGAAGANS